ncbi:MAG: hypothetical protein WCF85_10730 [Rhodospirillaceae bacterium]
MIHEPDIEFLQTGYPEAELPEKHPDARLVAELETALALRNTRIAELEAALAERDRLVGELKTNLESIRAEATARTDSAQVALADIDRRVSTVEANLERAADRAKELEAALARTTEVQHTLETEFATLHKHQQENIIALEAAQANLSQNQAAIEERDRIILLLRQELAKRAPPGTPAALGAAFVDLLRKAHQRRQAQLALTQPWRVPPDRRP